MFSKNKGKILEYLRGGKVSAYAPGFVRDMVTGESTTVELVSYFDEESEWTSEDIYNFEKYNIVFDHLLLEHISERINSGI